MFFRKNSHKILWKHLVLLTFATRQLNEFEWINRINITALITTWLIMQDSTFFRQKCYSTNLQASVSTSLQSDCCLMHSWWTLQRYVITSTVFLNSIYMKNIYAFKNLPSAIIGTAMNSQSMTRYQLVYTPSIFIICHEIIWNVWCSKYC